MTKFKDPVVFFGDRPFRHICETCGKEVLLSSRAAFAQGWDYPGRGGIYPESMFGVLSPRTCGKCTIDTTAWWQINILHKRPEELDERHKETLLRISQEPWNLCVEVHDQTADIEPLDEEKR